MAEDDPDLSREEYKQMVEDDALALLVHHCTQEGEEVESGVFTIPAIIENYETILSYEMSTPRVHPFSVREHSDSHPGAYAYSRATDHPEDGYRTLAIHQHASDVADGVQDLVEGELEAVDQNKEHGLVLNYDELEDSEDIQEYIKTNF